MLCKALLCLWLVIPAEIPGINPTPQCSTWALLVAGPGCEIQLKTSERATERDQALERNKKGMVKGCGSPASIFLENTERYQQVLCNKEKLQTQEITKGCSQGGAEPKADKKQEDEPPNKIPWGWKHRWLLPHRHLVFSPFFFLRKMFEKT